MNLFHDLHHTFDSHPAKRYRGGRCTSGKIRNIEQQHRLQGIVEQLLKALQTYLVRVCPA